MAVSDLNSVILIGNLVRDAELTYIKGTGTPVASMSIAVNRSRKEGTEWVKEVNYFDISYFGKPAEALKQYLLKGKQIAVQGSLKQDRWENKENGQKLSKIRIIADNIELLGGRGGSDGSSSGSYNNNGYSGNNGGYNNGSSQNRNFQPQSDNQYNQYDPSGMSDSGNTMGGDAMNLSEDIPF